VYKRQGAQCWLVDWWVLQFLEVVFVRPIPHVHFRLERLAAQPTGHPIPRVTLVVMIRAKCVATVVAIAAISGVGEEPVGMLIVADKVVATRGSDQGAGLSAQATARASPPSLRFRLRTFRSARSCHSATPLRRKLRANPLTT